MAAPILRDLVKANFPETWKVLATDPDPPLIDDQGEAEDIVGEALERVVDKWFRETAADGTTTIDAAYVEENYGRFVKGVVADMATRLVIEAAIDYYMVRTRTADSSSTTDVEGVGGDTSSNYDRVATLQQLDETLRQRIAEDMVQFLQEIAPEEEQTTTLKIGPRVSSMNEKMRTQNPDSLRRLGAPPRERSWPVGW